MGTKTTRSFAARGRDMRGWTTAQALYLTQSAEPQPLDTGIKLSDASHDFSNYGHAAGSLAVYRATAALRRSRGG